MLENKIHIFENPLQTAKAVAEFIAKEVSNTGKKQFNVAISGGSTPNLLFTLLSEEYKEKVDWRKIALFWVDERCVPADDSESNYGNVKKLLLDKVSLSENQIFQMIGENDPAFEVERYENLLVQNLPEKDKTPIFDLVLLGMGDDGHTASIFPNNLKLLRSENFVATAKHPTSGQNRITLTGVTIENALQILFVITGNSKAVVLDEILKEKHNSENYPAFHILKNTKAEIYLDRDASVRLKK